MRMVVLGRMCIFLFVMGLEVFPFLLPHLLIAIVLLGVFVVLIVHGFLILPGEFVGGIGWFFFFLQITLYSCVFVGVGVLDAHFDYSEAILINMYIFV